jgi:Beta-galactosidase
LLLLVLMAALGQGVRAEEPHAASAQSPTALVVAPFLDGEYFCDDAVNDPSVQTDTDAAALCAAHGQNAGQRIAATLDAIGPALSPSGKYRLGYTLTVPLFNYFAKTGERWTVDAERLKANLGTIGDVDRPVVVVLSANHFAVIGQALSAELAKDPRNLMWTRSGPMLPSQYFNNPIIAWTLVDQTAPVTVMRRQIYDAAVDAICALPASARDKIVGVSVLGETHELFPGLVKGPGFDIAPYDATDYSPVAIAGFRTWLAQKYSTIATLNHDLAANFDSFDTIDPPSKDIRKEPLKSYFEHIDAYAAGTVPVIGWINDTLGRKLTVTVDLDGQAIGTARTGLSRTDVTDAVPVISDPNLGFRYDLDYRNIPYGIHTLEVLVGADGQAPLQLTRRELVVVDRAQDQAMPIPAIDTGAKPMSTDPSLSGALDGPAALQSVFYNPLAQLWLEYRNQVVRAYIEQFAGITGKSCIPKEKIFSYQITPNLYGSWNGDLLATDASMQPDALYSPGATLYGGTAFGSAFLAMKAGLGWQRYSVSEMHPMIRLDGGQYRAMFEMHRANGAVFVAPYYMSMLPSRIPPGGDLVRFRIAADNPRYGSDLYRQSMIDLMKQ